MLVLYEHRVCDGPSFVLVLYEHRVCDGPSFVLVLYEHRVCDGAFLCVSTLRTLCTHSIHQAFVKRCIVNFRSVIN